MMRRLFSAALIATAFSAEAQVPRSKVPPPPPMAPLPERPAAPPPGMGGAAEEPRVTIPTQEGDVVEEVRDGGRVIMLKVTPKNGPTYYLQDPSGTGRWMRRDGLDSGTHGPMWPVFHF